MFCFASGKLIKESAGDGPSARILRLSDVSVNVSLLEVVSTIDTVPRIIVQFKSFSNNSVIVLSVAVQPGMRDML